MIKTVNILFLTFAILCQVLAQEELAKINDPDGFTNVRSGKGTDFSLVTKFDIDDLFFCEPSKDDWWRVHSFNDKKGYIHKTRITLIKNLSINDRRALIVYSINRLRNFRIEYDSTPSDKRFEKVEQFDKYEDDYSHILKFLPEIFCNNNDTLLLDQFINVMVVNKMSANEVPSWTLGYCYLCNPDLVIKRIKRFKGENRSCLINDLEFGFENVTFEKESEIKDYKNLKDKLVKLK
jgi:hypothetical protein